MFRINFKPVFTIFKKFWVKRFKGLRYAERIIVLLLLLLLTTEQYGKS